ncbi:OmpA family protein [Desulfonema magnum]|uniref:OmpA-like domain-containing protein n=1 Tax=Desulfonema magnum TaxID=45655 RepID=A0A975BGT7_9BACT|nr:OmpA family protein [Desulfonema magnum]QTA85116.1 OmpA-like domain-containing protein [Desulfonema magnum]
MHRIKSLIVLISLISVLVMLGSCAKILKPRAPSEKVSGPAEFETAIVLLARSLLSQVKTDWDSLNEQRKANLMIIPFPDKYSNEIPQISRTIEDIIRKESRENFKGFNMARLTSKNLEIADYILDGNIGLDSVASEKKYHVSAAVRNLKKIKVIGKSDVWISDQNLDYKPTGIYRDSSLYVKDERLRQIITLEKNTSRDQTDKTSLDALEIRAIWIEAETAYEEGEYETARNLFIQAEKSRGGQKLRTYIGLYLTNQKLECWEEAEKNLAKIISVSVEEHRTLTIKFLFKVNSVEFWGDKNLREKYDSWLRQIGNYFHQSPYCLRIVGHCSRTGGEQWNNILSLQRAKTIQRHLKSAFPEVMRRSEAFGKGFNENIVGIGTDDERDAIDRRVELIVVDCNE